MREKFLEGQYNAVERALRICLSKTQKKGGKHRNSDSLSTVLTLSYIGFLAMAFTDNTINNVAQNEKKIDEMVDVILSAAAD